MHREYLPPAEEEGAGGMLSKASQSSVITPSKIIKLLSHQSSHLASKSSVITPSKIIKLPSHQSSHLASKSSVITPCKIIKLPSHQSSHLASKSSVITPSKIIKLPSHQSSHLASKSSVITPSDSNWMQYPDGDQLLSFEKLDRASPDLWPEKNRASQVQLSEDTPEGPDVNLGAKREPKHHLRGPIKWCLEAEIFVVEGYFTVHTVFFDLRPADINSLAGEAGNEVPFVRNSAENSCDEIHETMTSVMRYQRDFRIKESIGRHIAETVHSHVSWVSLLHTFAILLTGLGQSFLLKRFFTEKSSDSVISSIKAET
ncbi:TMED7-like protein [Mya arenaria]|uniref:TMED7-like protein n=1 Tax=Mya arenaria TaxID=6604 RepID=A0ABY7FI62_MYAAR|nr:TMED7-like protein [Mya arenaria]